MVSSLTLYIADIRRFMNSRSFYAGNHSKLDGPDLHLLGFMPSFKPDTRDRS